MMGGVRHALDRHVDRAIGSRHAERLYLGGVVALGAVWWLLKKAGDALSR